MRRPAQFPSFLRANEDNAYLSELRAVRTDERELADPRQYLLHDVLFGLTSHDTSREKGRKEVTKLRKEKAKA